MSSVAKLRRRKTKQATNSDTGQLSEDVSDGKAQNQLLHDMWFFSNVVIGVLVMFYIAYKYTWYCDDLHEAQMWFTNIKEVEREISFRTESGLYYSYFKQIVNAPTLSQGLYEVSHDNLTEYPRTINILERMNIYQEVFLATIYRSFPSLQTSLKPIFFYKYSIFVLHGFLICALYIMAWLLAGSWITGVLATSFYIFNKEDTSRVAYVIPLRESFSLPFLWMQLALITYYFRANRARKLENLCKVGILVSTFLFSLCWQFNQFVLLLQSMALFGVQVLRIVPHYKIKWIYCVQIVSLLAVCILQFFNTMIICGLVFSFVPGALIMMFMQGDRPSSSSVMKRVFMTIIYVVAVFVLMAATNKLIKIFIHVDSDEHIYEFVQHKLGFKISRDMDVWMYLCIGAFDYLTLEFFVRLTAKLIFPLYSVAHLGGLVMLTVHLFRNWVEEANYKKKEDEITSDNKSWLKSRPELAYILIQTVFFGAMAMTTLRMKCLWTPYMCVLGSVLVSDKYIYSWVLNKFNANYKVLLEVLRVAVCIAVLCALYTVSIDGVRKELGNLREFYDPDTVELMEWISKNTPPGSSFSGSMQLMAGVKLCTGRPITNHPHYEDKILRDTTKQILQIYGRKPADEVHSILRSCGSHYIILEDSICLVPTTSECGTPTLMDMHNGETALKAKEEAGIRFTTAPKFCDEIRKMQPPYSTYFQAVFKNKTFRIYKVL